MSMQRVDLLYKSPSVALVDFSSDDVEIITELTEELLIDMNAHLERGYPTDTACRLLGISAATHQRWRRQGQVYVEDREQGRTPNSAHAMHAFYVIEINRASAVYLSGKIDNLNGDLNPCWVRDMTILERRDWQNWSRNVIVADREDAANPDESFL